MLSFGIAFVLGTAGLPHILVRFFTVPDAKAARGSVGWAVFLIGAFYLMVMVVGVGARAILGQAGEEAAGKGGNLAIPTLAESLGGGAGSNGGEIFLAVISAVALATILAVVAGLVISASGAVAHDLWSNVVRKGRDVSEREEVWVAKIAAIAIGALAIVLAIAGGAGFNVSALVGLAFCIAASANFPALVLALFWTRFNTAGAVTGIVTGVVVSAVLILLSDPVWPGTATAVADARSARWRSTTRRSTASRWASWAASSGRCSARRESERTYHELFVRSETGLGAEGVSGVRRRPRTTGPARGRGGGDAGAAEVVGEPAGGVVELTRELVRTETINPPGNETRAADILAARLEAAGLDVRRPRARRAGAHRASSPAGPAATATRPRCA